MLCAWPSDPSCEKLTLAERAERERHRRPPKSARETRPPKPAEEPAEAPSDPPESADRPSAAPPTPPKQPPREPTEAPPRPPPEKPARSPAASPKPPKSGCAPRAAIALLVLVAAIGAVAYFGGFLDPKEDLPLEVIVVTATLAPTATPVVAPATAPPTPSPTGLPPPTATPAEPTATPAASPLEIWQAADKAVHEALAAYDSAEGEERTAEFAVVEAAQAAEAHAFAVLHGLPTPTPLPATATPTPGPPTATPTATPPPTATPTPQPTATPTPRPTSTPTPRPTATPTPRPTSTPTPGPTSTPAPTLRYYKEYMLELINEARAEAGAPAVTLGDNRAPQIHAESALANCFSGHWGLDGLKPHMRYSLAGGYQSNGENALGYRYCPSFVRALPTIEQVVREAMDSWMGSPGHRRNILNPWHRKVSIGFAWNRHYYAAYQHFEGDYVEYDRLPTIGANGVLTISGALQNGATFRDPGASAGKRGGPGDDLRIQVYYDPPPHSLTRGQLGQTRCYDYGRIVGALSAPPAEGWFVSQSSFTRTYAPCPDPYAVPADTPPPSISLRVPWLRPLCLELPGRDNPAGCVTVEGQWITPWIWNVARHSFNVEADLSPLLGIHGPGVYTILVWGSVDGEEGVVISTYSMFYQVMPPDTYSAAS